jgi:5-methylcytosine-specific restriction protein A
MSKQRTAKGGWANVKKLEKGPAGRNLCRQCRVEVPKGRRTFCSDGCVDGWRMKTDPGYARQQVLARDRGVCCSCGLDTVALLHQLRALSLCDRRARYKQLAIPESRTSSLWDMDHIVSVVEGGGECGLDNYQTLCIPCHNRKTAELAARRAQERRSTVKERISR